MDDVMARFAENLLGRLTGPMQFRLILQPLMALILAARAGFRDARRGEAPYLWAMFMSRRRRRELLAQGWRDVGRVFLLAVAIDAVYQLVTERWIYPGELLVVATVLALVPYVLCRGAFTRLGGLLGMGAKS